MFFLGFGVGGVTKNDYSRTRIFSSRVKTLGSGVKGHIVAFTFIDATTACVCGWVGEWLMGEWERKRRSELVDVWMSVWASGRGRRGRVGE